MNEEFSLEENSCEGNRNLKEYTFTIQICIGTYNLVKFKNSLTITVNEIPKISFPDVWIIEKQVQKTTQI